MARERIPSTIYPSSESETDNGGQISARPKQTDLGKRVMYSSGNDRKTKYGTLRYWGKPEFATQGPYRGTWCGIELDDATGKNNGSIQGIRYFHCPPQCGIFVQLNKVELDPNGELKIRARAKTSVTSLVEKKATRKGSKYNEPPPFFYNTMPRSSSVSALNLCEASSSKYNRPRAGTHSPNHSPSHKPHPPPAPLLSSYSSNRLMSSSTTIDGSSKQHSPKKRSYSHHSAPSQLKKHSSEMNIFQKTSPIHITHPSPPHHNQSPINKGVGGGRSKLCSYSETSVLSSSVPSFNKAPLLSSTSCQDLSKLSPIKKLSVNSRRLSKKLSPDTTLMVSSPPSTIDSEDAISYYSSTSDLSNCEVSSDSDLTPRSSSNSPCFLDVESTNVPVILKPPSPLSPPSASKTVTRSPTHKVSLPTGLATPTSTLIESSRSGGNGECRVPSPDHQKISKIYLNSKNGRSTLDHPLVNGKAATVDKENKSGNNNEVFVCPSSGQEITVTSPSALTTGQTMDLMKLQNDVKTCLKQQAAMESRLSQMEDRLIQFQSLFMSTMEQVQETLKKQMEYNEGRKLHHHDNQGTWNNVS